jgi:serine/threonine-protein kinase
MATATEMIGKFIGDYQITGQLGEGGMGVVFKGVHPTLQQVVAIKMLHPNLVKAESIKQRFLREAQAMARLRHPNILQLYNFVENSEGCFIIMEFVEGKTFESLLEESGVLTPERAIDLFIPTLSAMKYAHDSGIIHRDIKPSNIMLLNSGTVKVMDFGTAKMAGGPALTAAGMTLGTVVYM